ncbi:glycerate kinase [Auraticoccus monumenti]|uniref:Glycerate kinase n=1 Tax=Auraticoccus monumenti TaxID=675864 RepID=A0A1G7DVH7_9ACTN|nr:glycerate kinase [Auraticoccus monumenti]SDE55461.1 glycerate kinase [Auraticoccus monumenti]
MRVLVASAGVAGIAAAEAGGAVARGWLRAAPGSELVVVPLAAGGPDLVAAAAYLWRADVALLADDDAVLVTARAGGGVVVAPETPPGPPPALEDRPGSHLLGRALAAVLADRPAPRSVVLDLTSVWSHDAGRGLLDELGGLGAARERLAGTRLVAVVAPGETTTALLGLRGTTALRGHATATTPDQALLVELDAELERFAREQAPEVVGVRGAGAAGGCGFAVLALGGSLVTGTDWLAEEAHLQQTVAAADVVVTTCTGFDFAHRGGPEVQAVAGWAAATSRPCVVLAGSVQIGARETRLMGVESAHALGPVPLVGQEPVVDPDGLEALALRVGRSWAVGSSAGR